MQLLRSQTALSVYCFGFEIITAATPPAHRPLSFPQATTHDISGASQLALAEKLASSLQLPQQGHHAYGASETTNNDITDLDRKLQEEDEGCIPIFISWILGRLNTTSLRKWEEVSVVQSVAFFNKFLFDADDSDESFGPNGVYTDEITTRREQLDTFWKANNPFVPSNETLVLSARAKEILNDPDKLRTIVEIVLCNTADVCGLSDAQLDNVIATVIDPLVEEHGIDNPALDATSTVVQESEALNDYEVDLEGYAIVIGDGTFTFLEDTNQIEHGPAYILAFEYSNVLLYELGLYDDENSQSVEGFRRLKLMADAFAAYFLSHEQGANLSVEEIDDVFLTARSIADYFTMDLGHHGTPAQRECAVLHYANVGFEDSTDLTVATIQELIADFDEMLPLILEVNDEICPNITLKPECYASFYEDTTTPTTAPSVMAMPSLSPSDLLSARPSVGLTSAPSLEPSALPTSAPTSTPTSAAPCDSMLITMVTMSLSTLSIGLWTL